MITASTTVHRVVFESNKKNVLCVLETDGEQVGGMFEEARHCEHRIPNSVSFIESMNKTFARCGHPNCNKEFENFCPIIKKWLRKEIE